MLGENGSEEEFGMMLTVNNIEKHLFDVRQKRTEYLKNHEEDVKEQQHLLDVVISQKGASK